MFNGELLMKLYIENALSNHRHGRFFISQLEAIPGEELPADGLVLLHGKTFQNWEAEKQKEFWDWSSKPGCALVLLPPFNVGPVYDALDWQIALADETASSDDGVVPNNVAEEVTLRIEGSDGKFEQNQGHQWTDYTINTRIFKQHSASGIFTTTCLPLWSISLLEYNQETLEWLEALFANVAKTNGDISHQEVEVELEPTDYTIMVCFSAWKLKNVDDFTHALSKSGSNIITLSELELAEGVKRLFSLGYIDEKGITDIGITELEKSPYWAYIDSLRESH